MMKDQRGGAGVVLIVLIILLMALGGIGYFAYKKKQAETLPPRTSFEHIDLNKEVVVFLFQKIPGLYSRVAQIDTELTLIDAELNRIDALGSEYPEGKIYVQSERSDWTRLKDDLKISAQTAQKAADTYYVAYMVNPEKGQSLIDKDLNDLLTRLDKVLSKAEKRTDRLETATQPTLIEKLKALL